MMLVENIAYDKSSCGRRLNVEQVIWKFERIYGL